MFEIWVSKTGHKEKSGNTFNDLNDDNNKVSEISILKG